MPSNSSMSPKQGSNAGSNKGGSSSSKKADKKPKTSEAMKRYMDEPNSISAKIALSGNKRQGTK